MVIEERTRLNRVIPVVIISLLIMCLVSVFIFPSSVFGDRVIKTPTTMPIYDVGDTREGDISVFEDDGNKCYVVMASSDNDEADISCVKK